MIAYYPRRCRSCGVVLHIRARGECDSCYSWHARHGWDLPRPAPPVACRACQRPWSVAGKHAAHGLCQRCMKRRQKGKA